MWAVVLQMAIDTRTSISILTMQFLALQMKNCLYTPFKWNPWRSSPKGENKNWHIAHTLNVMRPHWVVWYKRQKLIQLWLLLFKRKYLFIDPYNIHLVCDAKYVDWNPLMLGNRKLIQIAQTTSHGQWQRKKNCSVATVAHFDQIWASLKKTPVTVL